MVRLKRGMIGGNWWEKSFSALGFILLSCFTFLMILRSVYPWQYDYVEGLTVYISRLLYNNINIYSALPSENGFTAGSYPILAYLPGIISLNISNNLNPLYISRLFYVIASIISLGILYYLNNRDSKKWFLSIMLVNAFIAFPYWSSLIRSDILALPFILSYIFFLRKQWIIPSIIMGLFFVNIKQQYLYLLAYPFILLYLSKNSEARRKIMLSTIALIIGIIASYGLQELFFPGFIKTTFIYNMLHEKSFYNALYIFENTFLWNWYSLLTFILAVFFSLLSIYRKKSIMDLAILFILSFTASFLSSFKLGSNTNYYILPILLSSIIIAHNIPVNQKKSIILDKYRNIVLTGFVITIFLLSMNTVLQSYGFDTETFVEGYCIAEILSGTNEPVVWSDDYYVLYSSDTFNPVDAFYYSRLIDSGVAKDVDTWSVKPETVIWSYNPYRITPWIEHNINTYYKTVLIGDVYGVYTHDGLLANIFYKEYSSCYPKTVIIIQSFKEVFYPEGIDGIKSYFYLLSKPATLIALILIVLLFGMEGRYKWRKLL